MSKQPRESLRRVRDEAWTSALIGMFILDGNREIRGTIARRDDDTADDGKRFADIRLWSGEPLGATQRGVRIPLERLEDLAELVALLRLHAAELEAGRAG